MEQTTQNQFVRDEVGHAMEHIASERVKRAIKVQSTLRQSLRQSLVRRGFLEIPPVIISPLTDPLNHPVYDPHISCYGSDMWLTKSMIFHKQIAVQELEKIFIMSPNIRLETDEKATSGRHLYEFTQVDIEALEASRGDMMSLAEAIINEAIEEALLKNSDDLRFFERSIHTFHVPFREIAYGDAEAEYGSSFEKEISKRSLEPVWITDIPLEAREFYDREYESRKGILRDMDLIWPEGFQEAISGGEREYEYEKIVDRIHRKGQDERQFEWFLEMAKRGIRMSAGFGIGVERFTRYLCGLDHVSDTTPFPKIPGKVSL